MGTEHVQDSSTAHRRIFFLFESPLLQQLSNFEVFKVSLGQEIPPALSLMLDAGSVQLCVTKAQGTTTIQPNLCQEFRFPWEFGTLSQTTFNRSKDLSDNTFFSLSEESLDQRQRGQCASHMRP